MKDTTKVIREIRKLKTPAEYVSPNYVAHIAYNMGIELKVKEIIAISNNFEDK